MKYIKRFNESVNSKEFINEWVRLYVRPLSFNDPTITHKINDDLSVDIVGNIGIYLKEENQLPINIRKVDGNFIIQNITTLNNCPSIVTGFYRVASSKLESLEYAPKYVGGLLKLSGCGLTSIEPLLGSTVGSLDISNNNIKSLKGCPTISNDLFANSNNLFNVSGYTGAYDSIEINSNPISKICFAIYHTIFMNVKEYTTIEHKKINGFVCDKIEEFDIIKDENKVDFISLESMARFYEVSISANQIENLMSTCYANGYSVIL